MLVIAYVLSGLLAALGGPVAVTQLGALSPGFGRDRELGAIAAAVLGGVNGLVVVNADPNFYPMALASVIFVAVLLDGLRSRGLA